MRARCYLYAFCGFCLLLIGLFVGGGRWEGAVNEWRQIEHDSIVQAEAFAAIKPSIRELRIKLRMTEIERDYLLDNWPSADMAALKDDPAMFARAIAIDPNWMDE